MRRSAAASTCFTLGRAGAAVLLLAASLATPAQTRPPAAADAVFATVNGKTISVEEYQQALAAGMRQKFYHAKPPEAEVAQFQREVGEQLVNRQLLLTEGQRRGVAPDRARVEQVIAGYEKRYQGSEQWKANRERVLPKLVAQLESQSVLERLEQDVRRTEPPSADDARRYYNANRSLFTEPEQFRISLILLRVDPSSPRLAWDKAREEAARLHKRIGAGADFAEIARVQSADPSAEKGGDLGYLHRGMLPEPIQQQLIDSLKPGHVTPPVQLLEGFALVRLDDVKPARARGFDEVARRAAELLQRERGDKAWKDLVAQLRSRASIRIDESRYQPLAARQ